MKKLKNVFKLLNLNIKAIMENLPHYLKQTIHNNFIIDSLDIQLGSDVGDVKLFIYEFLEPGNSLNEFSVTDDEKIQLLIDELLEEGIALEYHDQKDI